MKRKVLFIVFSIITILLICSNCFAVNNMNEIKNDINSATDTVVDGTKRLGD